MIKDGITGRIRLSDKAEFKYIYLYASKKYSDPCYSSAFISDSGDAQTRSNTSFVLYPVKNVIEENWNYIPKEIKEVMVFHLDKLTEGYSS